MRECFSRERVDCFSQMSKPERESESARVFLIRRVREKREKEGSTTGT